jgi:Mn2+/Fe2+ NRAMP family transporter
LLWLDIIAGALITGAVVRVVLTERYGYAADDRQLLALSVVVPVSIWGSVFLAFNRRALDRLETKPARGRAR